MTTGVFGRAALRDEGLDEDLDIASAGRMRLGAMNDESTHNVWFRRIRDLRRRSIVDPGRDPAGKKITV